jgi:hypothetical protein
MLQNVLNSVRCKVLFCYQNLIEYLNMRNKSKVKKVRKAIPITVRRGL